MFAKLGKVVYLMFSCLPCGKVERTLKYRGFTACLPFGLWVYEERSKYENLHARQKSNNRTTS